jgi:cytochrome b6-f complex iron-sulfur subunit
MSTGTTLLIAIIVVVVLAVLFLAVTARSSDRNAATGLLARETERRDRQRRRKATAEADAAPPATGRSLERSVVLAQRGGGGIAVIETASPPDILRPPMDADQLGVVRRQFMNRSIILLFIASLGGFGASLLAFLWPSLSGGFGATVKVGKLDDILADIKSKQEPFYVAEARTYLAAYPKEALSKAKANYGETVYKGMELGVVALYQKCVHLGCKVPWCKSSQWFECPCHGSQYNRVGEKKGGPAPRGLDRFAVTVDGGIVSVNSGARTNGPAIGVNTTGQEAEGPHCVSE